jgi:carbonic anhydrase
VKAQDFVRQVDLPGDMGTPGVSMIARVRVAAVATVVFAAAVVAVAGANGAGETYTPQAALGLLKAGNDRFVRNASTPVSLSVNRRQELAAGQHPAAMVLSCADSRVPPEHVFNAGLGELLVIRTMGAVVDKSILATAEYGAEKLHIPLLVVMGHDSCDAVAAAHAKDDASSVNMAYLLKAIRAAQRKPKREGEEIKALILANVEQVVNDAMAGSPILQRMVDAGQLGVVGAYYEMESGRVTFSEMLRPGRSEPRSDRR